MSFTDLSNLAQQQQGQPVPVPVPVPVPQQPQQPDPSQLPPDPKSFTQSRTNPAQLALAGGVGVGAPGSANEAADLENTGAAEAKAEEKAPEETEKETNFPPIVLPPATYRPPSPNRDPTKLGSSWDPVERANTYPEVSGGPDMPSVAEAYPGIANTSRAMSIWGSPELEEAYRRVNFLASPFASIMDALSQGRFSKNFTASNLRALQIRQMELLHANGQAIAVHQQELQAISEIAKLESMGGFSKDPKQNQKLAEDAMRDYLAVNNPKLMTLFENRGIKGIYEYYKWSDAEFRKNLSYQTNLKKALNVAANNETLKNWGYEGSVGDDMSGLSGGRLDQPGARQAPDTPQTPPVQPYQPGSFDAQIAQQFNLSPRLLQAAQSIAAGEEPPGWADLAKRGPEGAALRDRANTAAMAIQAEVNRRAALPMDIVPGRNQREKSDNKADAIIAANRLLGTQIKKLGNYELDPKSESIKANNRAHILALTSQVYPDYKQSNYDKIAKFSDVTSAENRTMVKGTDVAQAATVVLDRGNAVLAKFGKNPPTVAMLKDWYEGKWGGAKEYADYFQSIFDLSQETAAVYALTGTGRVTLIEHMVNKMPPSASLPQITAQVRTEVTGVFSMMANYQDQWAAATGRGNLVPGMNRTTYQTLRGIARMNPDTGQFPAGIDIPNNLRAVEREGGDEKTRPISMPEAITLKKFIDANIRSPDPAVQKDVLKAQRILGPIMDMGRPIEGVDEGAD